MEFLNHELTPLPLASIVPFTEFSEPVFGLSINAIEKRKLTGRWELGFSVGTLAGYQAHNQKMGLDPNVQIFTADNLSLENSITGSGVQSLSGYAEIDATIKRPLGLEFSIARTFGKRGSVGSGIGLNYFTGQNLYPLQMTMRSNFLSISIPLVVDFDFVKRRRFEVSLGTGVVSEFPFRVTTKTTYTTPYETSTATKDFSGGYMGSVLFRTGFSYRLNEHLKIGLNPNLRYYFYQSLKSEMPVLERNFWGGVSLGATWTF
ncbi:MAG: hypothetical protein HYZ14_04305 [Bacteroidetes bacterium]|nr:hypothetical protein [Bacteroidota bacterium]